MSYFKGIGHKSRSFTGRKLPLIGLFENKKHTIFNKYTPGSGVGASSISARRLKSKQSRIKQCPTKSPIIPITLDTENIFEIDDTANFNDIEPLLGTLTLNTTLDLGTSVNEEVDANAYVMRINDIIDEIKPKSNEPTDDITSSITFTTRSNKNPALSAVNKEATSITDININEIFQTEDIFIATHLSEEINDEEENITQDIEHTIIYNNKNEIGQNMIDYLMTITKYSTLIN